MEESWKTRREYFLKLLFNKCTVTEMIFEETVAFITISQDHDIPDGLFSELYKNDMFDYIQFSPGSRGIKKVDLRFIIVYR